MQSMENKINQFCDKLIETYDGVNLYLAEIEETLAITNKLALSNQNLEDKNKRSQQDKARVVYKYRNKPLKTEIRKALIRKITKPIRRRGASRQWEDKRGKAAKQNEKSVRSADKEQRSVSVVIPAHTPNETIYKAVDSVLAQKGIDSVQVIIGVYGNDEAWYQKLVGRYSANPDVDVIYTEQAGKAAGRNICLPAVKCNYVFFLDDDDYITENLFAEMLSHMESGTQLVIAPFYNSDTGYDNSVTTEFARFLESNLNKKSYKYLWLFSEVTAKLFRKAFIENCVSFDEDSSCCEGMLFWADNFDRLTGRFACVSPESGEHYYRMIADESTDGAESPVRIIDDCINTVGKLENRIFTPGYSFNARRLILSYIQSQQKLALNQFEKCSNQDRETVREIVNQYQGFYLNKGEFSDKDAIAFCHNFAPYIDASSMVATRRLREIDSLTGTVHKWTVVDKNMSGYKSMDSLYKAFYANFVCSREYKVGGRNSINPKPQSEFAIRAFERVRDVEADTIYSRSMFPGSHLAAFLYKRKHPDAVWYAEFSDPVQKDSRGQWRQRVYEGDDAIFNDFWEVIEMAPYLYADHLIFTNEVQREYMLSYNRYPEYNDRIMEKSIISHHPMIGNEFAVIKKPQYEMDDSKINIGYFGTFYKNRSLETLLPLCDNPDVELHVFTSELTTTECGRNNIRVNSQLPFFEFLNIASRMDYVVLADMESSFGWTPWLPSKYSDYMSAGTTIIAQVVDGSPLSGITNDNLIKVKAFDREFANSLKKQK